MKTNFLKTVSTIALAAGVFLSVASADRRHDGTGRAIYQLERATGALLENYRCELRDQGIRKARGSHATLHKVLMTMAARGDNLVKYHRKGAGYATLAKAVARMDADVHRAEEVARHARVARGTFAGIRQVGEMVHTLNGFCGDNYREPAPRYDSRRPNRRDYAPQARYERPLRAIARRLF